MIKIVSVSQMRAIERDANDSGHSYRALMERAGRATAAVALEAASARTGARVLVLVGPGNNGGDGLVAARVLREDYGLNSACYLLRPRDQADQVFAAAYDAGVPMTFAVDDSDATILRSQMGEATIVLDALFGTGLRLPLHDEARGLLAVVSDCMLARAQAEPPYIAPAEPGLKGGSRPFMIAVDCPSGIDCDTGDADPFTLSADVSVTFAAAKPGHLAFPAAKHVGTLVVADIGIPAGQKSLDSIRVSLADAASVSSLLPRRGGDGHKGTYGQVTLLAGSRYYPGAAVLAGRAAYRAGAGLVRLILPEPLYRLAVPQIPEAIWLPLDGADWTYSDQASQAVGDAVRGSDVLLVGPGLGALVGARRLALDALKAAGHAAVVIDADGLNALREQRDWPTLLPPRTVLTPHPGEMSRLSGLTVAQIQHSRLEVAMDCASRWGCVVVLKGAFTVVANAEGFATVMPFATDALATAGTGDVLAGLLAGLLGHGGEPYDMAVCAAYIHGAAGVSAGKRLSSRAAIARDVIAGMPRIFRRLEAKQA